MNDKTSSIRVLAMPIKKYDANTKVNYQTCYDMQGVFVDKAMDKLRKIVVILHCCDHCHRTKNYYER